MHSCYLSLPHYQQESPRRWTGPALVGTGVGLYTSFEQPLCFCFPQLPKTPIRNIPPSPRKYCFEDGTAELKSSQGRYPRPVDGQASDESTEPQGYRGGLSDEADDGRNGVGQQSIARCCWDMSKWGGADGWKGFLFVVRPRHGRARSQLLYSSSNWLISMRTLTHTTTRQERCALSFYLSRPGDTTRIDFWYSCRKLTETHTDDTRFCSGHVMVALWGTVQAIILVTQNARTTHVEVLTGFIRPSKTPQDQLRSNFFKYITNQFPIY